LDNQWEMFLHVYYSSDAEVEEKQWRQTVVLPGPTELVDVVAATDMISEYDPATPKTSILRVMGNHLLLFI